MRIIALFALFAAIVVIAFWSSRSRRSAASDARVDPSLPEPAPAASDTAPYSTDAIESVTAECYKIAFGVARFDYRIFGEHAEVLALIERDAEASVHQRDYFPRRPLLLPKLLQAINDTDTTRQTMVRLILDDPALAGTVLQRANSAFYRLTPMPVESLDRAVALLGADGLRGLVATAILQPVFRLPKGYFDAFAPLTWEHAQRSSVAAESCARTAAADPFAAQLLGLLVPLARIVLFRLTLDKYKERPNILPRAEVFIQAMQAHGPRIARLIAKTWELSDRSLAALDEQVGRVSPASMGELGQAVYFGELAGALTVLMTRDTYSADGARAILIAQGLGAGLADPLLQKAARVERE